MGTLKTDDVIDRLAHVPAPKRYLVYASGPAIIALAVALVAQLVFGMHPCELCIEQRYPYLLIGIICTIALFFCRSAKPLLYILSLLATLYLLETGLAAHHAGVEWGVFEGSDSCVTKVSGDSGSLDMLKHQILGAPLVSCDAPAFVFLGLSMAGWNALYALACFVWCLALARKTHAMLPDWERYGLK